MHKLWASQFGNLAMRFLAVAIAFSLTFIVDTTSITLKQKQMKRNEPVPGLIYYDCGSRVFYENVIQEILTWNKHKIPLITEPFRELLNDLKPGYRRLSIPVEFGRPYYIDIPKKRSIYYAILDQINRILDVVAEMKNGHYIMCKRVDESALETSYIDPNTKYGFKCGHDLFSYETIEFSVTTASLYKASSALYPAIYHGALFEPGTQYWIFPVLRGKRFHQLSRLPEDTYFVVLNSAGKLIDVIAELKNKDFLKCDRTTEVPDADTIENLRVGFLCGVEFFDITHMRRTADLARARMETQDNLVYPKSLDNSPQTETRWIYPLHPNGMFNGRGNGKFIYYLIMDSKFEVQIAAEKTPQGIFKPCEASMRGIEAPAERDGFVCDDIVFDNKILLKAIKTACKFVGTRNRRYPAKYIGPDFNTVGPYLTWPLGKGNKFAISNSNYRVVMNLECQLAGVIAKNKSGFYKCKSLRDKSMPEAQSSLPITESLLIPSREGVNHRRRFKHKTNGKDNIQIQNK